MFKTINDFPAYEINECGIVRRVKDRKILKYYVDKDGYFRIALYCKKIRKFWKLHRLVAREFIGKITSYDVIHHKDFDVQNNHVSNLEIMSQTKNLALRRKKVKKSEKKVYKTKK